MLIDRVPVVLMVGLVVAQYESAFSFTVADDEVMSTELSV